MFDLQFGNKEILYCLLGLPVLAVLFVLYLRKRKNAMQKIGNNSVLKNLMPEYSSSKPIIRAVLLGLTLTCMIFALARPRMGSKLKETKSEGSEIMICLDISNSMRATDIYPSRLENCKNSISNLVKKLGSDRVGLIIFAGTAYVQVPMTMDLNATDIFVQSVDCDMISEQGTVLGEALSLAYKSFNFDDDLSKAIILVSDGENNEESPDPVNVAKTCYEKGIAVYTIGMGSSRGVPIPTSNGSKDYMKDRSGNIVVSKLDETTLQKIAQAGGGKYVHASNGNSGFSEIYSDISKMKKGEISVFAEYDEKFTFPAVMGLIFFVAYCLTLERKNRWIKNLGIFD